MDSRQASVLLDRMCAGDSNAGAELYGLLYSELHRRARGLMQRQPAGHTLQPTALVHEAWIKLEQNDRASWNGHRHFLRVASSAMRSALVDHARARTAAKRGGDRERQKLEPGTLEEDGPIWQILALDEAIATLAECEPRVAHVAELRLFGGLEAVEIAKALDVSTRTVEREWKRAREALRDALEAA